MLLLKAQTATDEADRRPDYYPMNELAELRLQAPAKRVFEFTVMDKPEPMARKLVQVDKMGKPHHYTAKKDARSLYWVRETFLAEFPNELPISGPVHLSVRYFHRIPTTWSLKKKKAAWMRPCVETKPDIPNLLAQVCDALTGYAYTDDSKVVWSEQWKFYAVNRDGIPTQPRYAITVTEL